jgi:hypothetical protein
VSARCRALGGVVEEVVGEVDLVVVGGGADAVLVDVDLVAGVRVPLEALLCPPAAS